MKKLACIMATAVVIGTDGSLPATSSAASDMFIKIGEIAGESQDKVYKDTCDVLAWSWGASVPTAPISGGGGATGKPELKELTISKFVDKASPLLFQSVAKGDRFKNATLMVRKAGLYAASFEYMRITLGDVAVTSITPGGSGAEDRFTETITLTYSNVVYTYTPQNPNDGTPGTPVSFNWSAF